jgi:hypothetical protein
VAGARADLGAGRPAAGSSPVVDLLLTAAELHTRADLGVVDAAEQGLRPEVLEALRASAGGQQAGERLADDGGAQMSQVSS